MQSIKCGKCRSTHTGETYAKVREQVQACYAGVTPEPETAPEPAKSAEPTIHEVPEDGFYTVVFDGPEDYLTLRVAAQDEDDEFMPGRTLVGYLMGPDNTDAMAYTTFGHFWESNGKPYVWKRFQDNARLAEALRVIANDPAASREAYAVQSERCARCNRPLTVPTSIHRGLGPTCAEKMAS